MKSESVKTISIYLVDRKQPAWIFDVSDKTAEKILCEYDSPSSILVIENVPTKTKVMTLYIPKTRIDYVTVE